MPNLDKNLNNKGFSLVPLVILVLAIGLVGFFSYNSFNKKNNDVLQSKDPFPSINLNFSAKENSNFIEIYLSGSNVDDFVKELPAENRVEVTVSSGKKTIVKYKNFAKTPNGGYVTSVTTFSNDAVSLVFLDLKLGAANVNFIENSLKNPWRYNNRINGIDRVLQTQKTKLDVSFKPTSDILNQGTLTFKFTEQSSPVGSASSIQSLIKNNGIILEYFCQTTVCPKPQIIKPRLVFDKSGYYFFTLSVTNGIQKVSLNLGDLNSLLEITSIPERFSINSNRDGIEYNSYGISGDFNLLNASVLQITLQGDGLSFFNLIKSLRTSGYVRSDCLDLCKDFKLIPSFRSNFSYRYTFNVPVNRSTKTINLSSLTDGSIDIYWIKSSIPGWQVTKNKLGLERFTKPLAPSVTITERKDSDKTNYYFFTIEGYGDSFNNLVSSFKKGIEVSVKFPGTGMYDFYPPLSACISFMNRCQFGVSVPVENTYFLFRTDEKLDFKQIPTGWKVNNKGNGISK